MWIVRLALTVVLTLYTVWRRWKYSRVQACVRGTGFFTVGCYLDIIFSLIMAGVGEDGLYLFLQGMGIFISKGIMIAVLVVEQAAEQGQASGREAIGRGYNGEGYSEREYGRKGYGSGAESGTIGQGWQYLDVVTVGITLFFLFLAVLVLWCVYAGSGLLGGIGLGGAWILTFFLAVLLVYDCSYYLHGKTQQEKSRRLQEEVGRHEADVYLENVEDHYQRTRELWHDLKNHITLLSLLLEEGKYVQMEEYLHIFAEDVDALTLPVKSGNLVVDALLADKLSKARKQNIPFRLSLCNLTGLPLKPNEICGILGNLLDNALEASELMRENGFIAVECEEKEYGYYMRIRNAVAGGRGNQGRESGSAYRSAKSDRRNQVGHGLGLRSVERIVHGCGGDFVVDRTETQFTAAIRLPKV